MAKTSGTLQSQKERFERDGFVVLKRFFTEKQIEKAQNAIDLVKQTRPFDVVIDDLENGARTVLGLMSPEAVRTHRMKINDLYLTCPEMRDLALAQKLVPPLRELLGYNPALCNSLYLEKGSEQDKHIDSLYMTPSTLNHLIASWIALEDTHEDAGELEYFPGSHLIEPMVFSNGTHHAVDHEMTKWMAYIQKNMQDRQIEPVKFKASKGDVLIWHSNLVHAGSFIKNLNITRKSCVFHYFSEDDAVRNHCVLVPHGEAFWIKRAPQTLPIEISLQLPFNEDAYLSRYPDVEAAVKQGHFVSGKQHYDLFGKNEGRLPA